MDSIKTNSNFSSLVKENATKNKPVEIPQISLPKGGGALKGIDEKFTVNPSNGTGNFEIPIPVTAGRSGCAPAMSLRYNSGSGNSAFGLGWTLSLPSIQRKTDKSLPMYYEGTKEDTFLFSGAEDLVPFLEEQEDSSWTNPVMNIGAYTVRRFRPRLEGEFSKIEQVTSGGISPSSFSNRAMFWKVTTKSNVVTFYGKSEHSRITDPKDKDRIFQWLPEFSYDDKGNWILYEYKQEDLENVPFDLHEKNRHNRKYPITNSYIKRIKYGNRVPYYTDPQRPYDFIKPDTSEGGYFYELVFDYGDHNSSKPEPIEASGKAWTARKDPFSSFRAGFEIRAYRLCQRILLFHRFSELGTEPCLVKSMDFEYKLEGDEVSLLVSVTQRGYKRRSDGSYSQKSVPPLSFEYEPLKLNTEIKEVPGESLRNLPIGISGSYQWIDLYNEGIPGIFTEHSGAWSYKENFGDVEDGTLKFSESAVVMEKPSFEGINRGILQLNDLESSGSKQLMINQKDLQGYWELSEDDKWQPFKNFAHSVNVDLTDPKVKLLDLNGDGIPDILVLEDRVFTYYISEGKKGYSAPSEAFRFLDEEINPIALYASGQEAIYLADMSGGGLTDIVRVRNGEVCYWPNLGYGRFGAKVTMSDSPYFDNPDAFNPQYIFLSDINGSGPTDIVYYGKDKFRVWFNRNGNSFSGAFEVNPGFGREARCKISILDLLGKGTGCIVWSSELPCCSDAPMKYIDLLGGNKPYLLRRYCNNMGKETELEYRSSTWYYLKDKLRGKPWITKLPFPVHCVSKMTVFDKISRVRFTSEYTFHHGYYDQSEREFRGFGMVEQVDSEKYEEWIRNYGNSSLEKTEETFQKPTLIKTWYHTGAYINKDKILNCFEKEYWYEELKNIGLKDIAQKILGIDINAVEYKLPDGEVVPAELIREKEKLLDNLTDDEWREAYRACKGMLLRQEIFTLDAPQNGEIKELLLQALPYSAASHNYTIRLHQPRGANKYCTFQVMESEAITYQYERDLTDPRITHTINVAADDYGNITEMAKIFYARNKGDWKLPPDIEAVVKNIQDKTLITYTKSSYTDTLLEPTGAYRLPVLWEGKTYEITGLFQNEMAYKKVDFRDIMTTASKEVPYTFADYTSYGDKPHRRLIECMRNLYYNNDLTGPLDAGKLSSNGLVYESLQLAFTLELLSELFPEASAEAMEKEGKFKSFDSAGWWISSGTAYYLNRAAEETLEAAKDRFYMPISFTGPTGSEFKLKYFKDYYMMPEEIADPLENKTTVKAYDFRTVSPIRIVDANDNVTEVLLDELGLVKAAAIMGKDKNGDGSGDEGDNLEGIDEFYTEAELKAIEEFFAQEDSNELVSLAPKLVQKATVRYVNDFESYGRSGKPAVIAEIKREKHYSQETDPQNTKVQISFEYSCGSGTSVMSKAMAEPGEAKKLVGDSVIVENTAQQNPPRLRWIGNGRKVLNNKGKPVKEYESYFSVTPFYEDSKELVESGATSIKYYDPMGRLVRTLYPDHTESKVVFTPWKQTLYDQNDTVGDSGWYKQRINREIDDELIKAGKDPDSEKRAAEGAHSHHDTPVEIYFDTLGRPRILREHNKDEEGNDIFTNTFVELDIEGNTRTVTDSRGNACMEFKSDLLGHRVYQKSMDSGIRRTLNNAGGKPVRQWDERQHEFIFSYDALDRLLMKKVTGGERTETLNNVVELIIYGEGQKEDKLLNLRGKPWIHYDTAGKLRFESYDFKGNKKKSIRSFASDYKSVVNWTGKELDSKLEQGEYVEEIYYDALNRPCKNISADGSITEHFYNSGGLLEKVTVEQKGMGEEYVKKIEYNEKGQRKLIEYGNGIRSSFRYDEETFRLIYLKTEKADGELLQALSYTYDPSGNITNIKDRAVPTVFFNNQKVEGSWEYSYDALYRLIKANGREHEGQMNFKLMDNWEDKPFLRQYSQKDIMAWRNYTESYSYDEVGNLTLIDHSAGSGSFKRYFDYEACSNRLKSTSVGMDIYDTFEFSYHKAHGLITSMANLQTMDWNFKDELFAVSKEKRSSGGTPETIFYVYDSQGQRVRKVTEAAAAEGETALKKCERLYIGICEIYREYIGQNKGLERKTLHVMEDKRRLAMLETRNEVNDGTPERLVRYQLTNHLDTASLETDEKARVISYEEFHPYGTTAYQAADKDIAAAAKRYRYTGKERDEESGLYYHGARYYACWLGRWISPDPMGLVDGTNLYTYVRGNPVKMIDPQGTDTQLTDFDATVGRNNKQNYTKFIPPNLVRPNEEEQAILNNLKKDNERTVEIFFAAKLANDGLFRDDIPIEKEFKKRYETIKNFGDIEVPYWWEDRGKTDVYSKLHTKQVLETVKFVMELAVYLRTDPRTNEIMVTRYELIQFAMGLLTAGFRNNKSIFASSMNLVYRDADHYIAGRMIEFPYRYLPGAVPRWNAAGDEIRMLFNAANEIYDMKKRLGLEFGDTELPPSRPGGLRYGESGFEDFAQEDAEHMKERSAPSMKFRALKDI